MKEVQDRVVQFSNRYKLTDVSTGEVLGTFDFDEVTGTVQQVGTEIDAELFQSIADDLAARVVSNGGELKDTVVTFTDTTGTAANVASGDKTSTLWSKVKNWFSRLKALAFKDTIRNADVASNAAIAQSKISGLESALASKANNADLAAIAKSGDLADATQDATHRVVTDTEKSTWNKKQNAITGAASTIASQNLTANRALVSNGSGKVGVSAVTSTELGYLDGVTSNIQNQLNGKYVKPSGGIPATDLTQAVQASLDKADSALQSAPVTSVADKTGAVTLGKADVGLGNVDNVKQYSASNPPPYPVRSVNEKTGAVNLTTADAEVLSGLAFDEGFGQTSGNIVGYRIGDLVVISVRFVPGPAGIAWRDWALATGLPLPRVEGNLNPNPQYVGMCMPATPCALSADGITDVQFNLRVYERSSRLWIHRCTTTNGSKVGAGIEFSGTIVYVCQ